MTFYKDDIVEQHLPEKDKLTEVHIALGRLQADFGVLHNEASSTKNTFDNQLARQHEQMEASITAVMETMKAFEQQMSKWVGGLTLFCKDFDARLSAHEGRPLADDSKDVEDLKVRLESQERKISSLEGIGHKVQSVEARVAVHEARLACLDMLSCVNGTKEMPEDATGQLEQGAQHFTGQSIPTPSALDASTESAGQPNLLEAHNAELKGTFDHADEKCGSDAELAGGWFRSLSKIYENPSLTEQQRQALEPLAGLHLPAADNDYNMAISILKQDWEGHAHGQSEKGAQTAETSKPPLHKQDSKSQDSHCAYKWPASNSAKNVFTKQVAQNRGQSQDRVIQVVEDMGVRGGSLRLSPGRRSYRQVTSPVSSYVIPPLRASSPPKPVSRPSDQQMFFVHRALSPQPGIQPKSPRSSSCSTSAPDCPGMPCRTASTLVY